MSDHPFTDPDIERSLLSALIGRKYAMKELMGEGIEQDSFSVGRYGVIFKALEEMQTEGYPINWLSLSDYLAKIGQLEKCGGKPSIEGIASKLGVADVAHFARILRKNHLVREEWALVTSLKQWTCDEKADGYEILAAMEEGIAHLKEKFFTVKKGITEKIKDWVSVTEREWSVTELDKEVGIVTMRDKNARRQTIHRLLKEDVIVKSGNKENMYRKVNDDCKPLDWINCKTDEYPMRLPLQLDQLVRVMPGNIILLAGESNAGKSAMALRIACMNMQTYSVHYFSSEMGEEEFKDRLSGFEDEGISLLTWNNHVKFYERSGNYADIVKPNDLNVFDYLEAPSDKPAMVGDYLRDIHARLKAGVAVVSLQRAKGAEFGRGGQFTLDKPRLYLNIDPNRVKIVKAKLWRDKTVNPNGLICDFALIDGCKFIPQGGWYKEAETVDTKKVRTYR
jgi:hypothetical protein